MDSLSIILREIRIQGSVHFNACFQSPWGLNVGQDTIASFHLVVSGHCWLTVQGIDEPIAVKSGDAVILPHGTQHQLYDSCPSHCIPALDVVKDIKKGHNPFDGDNSHFNIACGYFQFERCFKHQFVESLPTLIHITQTQRERFAWLDTAMQLLVCESASDMAGKSCFLDRVTELFFIHVIRVHMHEVKDKNDYFAALGDRYISIAIKLMHTQLETPWTLETLAKRCGMSRSRFAQRFKALVGMTAMTYLTTCRMLQAKRLISSSDVPLNVVAEQVGYQSESAFKAAFKKFHNQTPASYRKQP